MKLPVKVLLLTLAAILSGAWLSMAAAGLFIVGARFGLSIAQVDHPAAEALAVFWLLGLIGGLYGGLFGLLILYYRLMRRVK